MKFSCKPHEDRFLNLIAQDKTHITDKERLSSFYIISSNADLYEKRNYIYDFKKHFIKQCLTEYNVDFSSGCKALVKLAFNLYNHYDDGHTSPYHLFYSLDDSSCKLAINAIKLRFLSNEILEFDHIKENDRQKSESMKKNI